MSYGPSDDDKIWMQAFSDSVEHMYDPAPTPLWRRAMNYPCFIVLAGAQVVRRRWDDWRAIK